MPPRLISDFLVVRFSIEIVEEIEYHTHIRYGKTYVWLRYGTCVLISECCINKDQGELYLRKGDINVYE